MSKKANKTAVGLFVVVALLLFMAGMVVFGSSLFFKQTRKYVLYFDGSVNGLSIGAPVIFRGVKLGIVKDITLVYDLETKNVLLPVVIEIEKGHIKGAPDFVQAGGGEALIDMGVKAKLEVQSYVTGQLFIALDFFPERPAVFRGGKTEHAELPTMPISPDIFSLMDEMPLIDISKNLNGVVKGLNTLVNSGDLQRDLAELRNTLHEVRQASRSMRFLTEYLEQHPEAILKGKADSARRAR